MFIYVFFLCFRFRWIALLLTRTHTTTLSGRSEKTLFSFISHACYFSVCCKLNASTVSSSYLCVFGVHQQNIYEYWKCHRIECTLSIRKALNSFRCCVALMHCTQIRVTWAATMPSASIIWFQLLASLWGSRKCTSTPIIRIWEVGIGNHTMDLIISERCGQPWTRNSNLFQKELLPGRKTSTFRK